MKLPNGASAVVSISKLRDYCLSATHPRGRHKARVFNSALSLTAVDVLELQNALLLAARQQDAVEGLSDAYGTRYTVDFELKRMDRSAFIRSSWIISRGELVPRFVTCFIL
jgi:hypothetical protein